MREKARVRTAAARHGVEPRGYARCTKRISAAAAVHYAMPRPRPAPPAVVLNAVPALSLVAGWQNEA